MNASTHSPCPVCGGQTALLDVLDFNKVCGDPGLHFQGLSGTPIYYAHCTGCGFCFAPEIAQWTPAEFETRIYNQDYIQVDPEFIEHRPREFAKSLQQLFGDHRAGFTHLDYGGGNGLLSRLLNEAGWTSRSYDPFVNHDVDPAQIGKFDLITAFEVFEHVPDPQALMSALRALLAPGGVVYFSTQLSDGHIAPGQRLNWWYAAPRNGHISLFSKAALQHLAQHHGFSLASNWVCFHALFTSKPAWAGRLIP
jgi:SAM-dependent methyltransferase